VDDKLLNDVSVTVVLLASCGIAFGELEGTGGEMILLYMKVVSRHSLKGTEKITKLFDQDHRCSYHDSNLASPDYKSERHHFVRS
jgi:hypothetical protein